ncbi:MAG: penicillin-binding protein activator LpoB [Nitrospiraceae bacterium]|nr:MAG: penicillin-binding protein activator LpoB [Nitrospiraceae bacterium]
MRTRNTMGFFGKIALVLTVISLVSCTASKLIDIYFDPNMDLGAVRTAAVMPFDNLTREQMAADRVRDVFINKLLSTGEIYVVPSGEVKRGILLLGISNPSSPSTEETVKLASLIKVDVIITGTVREYGEVRSGTTSANIISLSLQMIEGLSGKIIWTASSTKGGISTKDRLLGGGGRPMNDVTEEAVNDILNKFFF